MNIFVTVGTTPFDSLIKAVDQVKKNRFKFIFQISNGEYLPEDREYFRFTMDIEKYYHQADVVITHAGAGSIYRLLELKKKIVIVPNLDRFDQHQLEIAKFMSENKHALSCTDLTMLIDVLGKLEDFNPVIYEKDQFFAFKDIVQSIEFAYS